MHHSLDTADSAQKIAQEFLRLVAKGGKLEAGASSVTLSENSFPYHDTSVRFSGAIYSKLIQILAPEDLNRYTKKAVELLQRRPAETHWQDGRRIRDWEIIEYSKSERGRPSYSIWIRFRIVESNGMKRTEGRFWMM